MLKNGKKLSQIVMTKQHNIQVKALTIYQSHWVICRFSEKGCDANFTGEILVNQAYVTQVNHEILNAKEKELKLEIRKSIWWNWKQWSTHNISTLGS